MLLDHFYRVLSLHIVEDSVDDILEGAVNAPPIELWMSHFDAIASIHEEAWGSRINAVAFQVDAWRTAGKVNREMYTEHDLLLLVVGLDEDERNIDLGLSILINDASTGETLFQILYVDGLSVHDERWKYEWSMVERSGLNASQWEI